MDVLAALDIYSTREADECEEEKYEFSHYYYTLWLQHLCFGYRGGDFNCLQYWEPLRHDIRILIENVLSENLHLACQQLVSEIDGLRAELEDNRACGPPNGNSSGKRKKSSSGAWNRPQNSWKRPKNNFNNDEHVPFH